jgi:hypothetical protein
LNIAHHRLVNQRLASSAFTTPDQVVTWLGAVQAQDFEGAKWAIGQRMIGATNHGIEQAFSNGTLLRTHVMRPTWHFVAPSDIRWMLKLTAPRVKMILASYNRRLEVDDSVFKRSNKAFAKALKNGKQLTRSELKEVLQGAGINTDDQRLVRILANAELDGLICSGPKNGKQFTYALLDDRVPPTKDRTREESLADLTRRYFTSHGPATLQDFAWWSGLTRKEIREGLDLSKREIRNEVFAGKTYWFAADMPTVRRSIRNFFLLPAYDEYLVAYKDRSAAIDARNIQTNRSPFFDPTVVSEGRVIGTWRRSISNGEASIRTIPLRKFREVEKEQLRKAAKRYGDFLGMKVIVVNS